MSNNKIRLQHAIIELYNNAIGVQRVSVNGQIVSKKFSFSGTDHHFSLMEEGLAVSYVLTTKTSSRHQRLKTNQVLVDLKRADKTIIEDLLLDIGKSLPPKNKPKAQGLKRLQAYELTLAKQFLDQALLLDRNDPELYFYLACCYSLEEQTQAGFEQLRLAVAHHLPNIDVIFQHDMLAFLRMQEGFAAFAQSNFTKYE